MSNLGVALSFVEMDEAAQLDFLDSVRARRLVAVMYYEEAQKERAANRRVVLDRKFEIVENRLRACISRIDAELLKADEYFRRVNILKLESM
jgi:hypothetical protein